jgi:hypothetical protein
MADDRQVLVTAGLIPYLRMSRNAVLKFLASFGSTHPFG